MIDRVTPSPSYDDDYEPKSPSYEPYQGDGIARVAAFDRMHLDPEDVKTKAGNYIFSFGSPGSGKTTFQWFLTRYLVEQGDFRTEVSVPTGDKGEDWDGRRLLNEWKMQWVSGRFPASTPSQESDIREMSLTVKPMSGQNSPCSFSFLEMSGELLRMVDPSEGDIPQLADTIDAYLANEKIRFIVFLMLHPEEERNDNLFASFMNYLEARHPSIKDRMSIALVVSKPRESLQKLQMYGDVEGRTEYDTFDEVALEKYIDKFAGEAYSIYRSWPRQNRALMSSLFIGDIELDKGEPILRKPSYDNISGIFDWIYNQFTGKHLGPTLWQRIFGGMSGWR